MKTLIRRFLLMMQFLTSIPIPLEVEAYDEDFGKGLVLAPLVGLVLGGILGISYFALHFVFSKNICAVFILIEYVFLTGGLHMDGLGDTFDGIFSNRPKERILEIMRDSRVGTNAVLASVLVLLLNYSLLSGMNSKFIIKVLILMPVAGRVGSIIGASLSDYARKGEGLGKSFIDYCSIKEFIAGIIVYILCFLVVNLKFSYIIIVFPIITAVIVTKLFTRKINGATGDVLGAICEINQTLFLITAYIVLHFGGII